MSQQYSDRDKLLARMLYCQGLSFDEIAAQLSIPRKQTVWAWKEKAEPDGKDWDEARREFLDRVRRQLEQQSADELSQVLRRQLQVVQVVEAQAIAYLRGATLYTRDGTPVTLPKLEPRTFGEAVRALKDAIMLERLIREQPTQVARLELDREVTAAWTPEQREEFVRRLLQGVEERIEQEEK